MVLVARDAVGLRYVVDVSSFPLLALQHKRRNGRDGDLAVICYLATTMFSK